MKQLQFSSLITGLTFNNYHPAQACDKLPTFRVIRSELIQDFLTNSVYVTDSTIREIVVDDQVDSLEIDTTTHHLSAD